MGGAGCTATAAALSTTKAENRAGGERDRNVGKWPQNDLLVFCFSKFALINDC